MTSVEKLKRYSSPALDDILGKKFPVLDDGFIRVVDYMGAEGSIVQAARVSYGKGTKKVAEDRGLLRYLMRHNHGTPIEMCWLKLHIRIPMDHWRQMIRHRTASANEYSTRYSEAIDEKQTTDPEEWRIQGKGNKQGSEGFVSEFPEGFSLPGYLDEELAANLAAEGPGAYLTDRERRLHDMCREVYQERLKFGVAREVARKDLPLSTYTEAYWGCNLRNLLHFLGLRMDSHAQKEIRDYANIIGNDIVSKWVPNVWEAFNDYHPLRGAVTFSRLEMETLKKAMTDHDRGEEGLVRMDMLPDEWCQFKKDGTTLKRNRERDEFLAKLPSLGFVHYF